MKRFIISFICSIPFLVVAQAPQKISYQAVARNSSGTLISNQTIAVGFRIYQGSATGTLLYSEIHNPVTTNAFGLFTVFIGGGTTTDNFSSLNWSNGPYFIETSIDPTASGSSFVAIGNQQLMSVPYALYAEKAGNATAPTITINAPNTINSNTTTSSYSITVPSYTAGSGISISSGVISNTAVATTPTIVGNGLATVTPTTGNTFTVSVPNPTLSLGSGSISISNGNSIALPTYSLTQGGSTVSLTQNGSAIATVTLASATTSLSAGNANITLNQVGNNYTITPVAPSFTNAGPTTISGTYPNYTVNSVASASTSLVSGNTNLQLIPSGNTYTLDVKTYSLTSNSNTLTLTNGAVFSHTSTVVIPDYSLTANSNTLTLDNGSSITTATVPLATLPLLSVGGGNLQSGPISNTVSLNAINNWSLASNVLSPATITNSVGIGFSSALGGRFGISHTSSSSTPHINLLSPAGGFGRIKFSNTSQSNYFLIDGRNNGGGVNDGFTISQYNGTNERQVFSINGDRRIFVNALNLPLASFHVMEDASTSGGGIISEGFNKAGLISISRNNQTALARLAIVSGNEIGSLVFSGFNGASYGLGNSKITVKATENFAVLNQGSEMIFSTVPNGNNLSNDVMTLTNTQDVLIHNNIVIPSGAGSGKILTSDAAGKGIWALPQKANFSVDYTGNFAIPAGTLTPIAFNNINYNTPNGSIVAGSFTAPITGIYHIDASVLLSIGLGSPFQYQLQILKAGGTLKTSQKIVNPSTESEPQLNISADVFLTIGEIIQIGVFHNSTGTVQIFPTSAASTYFNCHLVN